MRSRRFDILLRAPARFVVHLVRNFTRERSEDTGRVFVIIQLTYPSGHEIVRDPTTESVQEMLLSSMLLLALEANHIV